MKKFRLLVLALVPMLALSLSACMVDPDGEGYDIVGGVWEIENEDGLKAFAKEVATDNTIDGKLVNNIVLTSNWDPIPTYAGTFDGNGHRISNLTINQPTFSNQGLFSVINTGGVVQDLRINSVNITANETSGALVGTNRGRIINVEFYDINITGVAELGGLVGENQNFIAASFGARVSLIATGGGAAIGGVAGINRTLSGSTKATIIASYVNDVELYLQNTTNSYGGGIVGLNSASNIISTYAYNVSALNGNTSTIGGIVGYGENTDNLDENYFYTDESFAMFGTADFGSGVGSDANANEVTSVLLLNNSVPNMNNAIDGYVRLVGPEFGFKYEVLRSPNNASVIPPLVAN